MQDYPDNILDSFYCGSYTIEDEELLPGQSRKFNDAFRLVDGMYCPLSLVHPDIPQKFDQLVTMKARSVLGYSDPDDIAYLMLIDLKDNLDPKYETKRTLFDAENSYISELNLSENDFRDLIAKLSMDFGHRALAVLDAGCGDGNGFRQLLHLAEIDRENSVGLTLPTPSTWAHPDLDLLYANIMHCGAKRRFDLTLSVHGAFRYHPTNFLIQKDRTMLALLHAINLTQDGGIILDNSFKLRSIQKLVDDGIVRNKVSGNVGLRVLRHPTVDEVMKYTRAKVA